MPGRASVGAGLLAQPCHDLAPPGSRTWRRRRPSSGRSRNRFKRAASSASSMPSRLRASARVIQPATGSGRGLIFGSAAGRVAGPPTELVA